MKLPPCAATACGDGATHESKPGRLTYLNVIASLALGVVILAELPYVRSSRVLAAGVEMTGQEEIEEVSLTLRPEGFDPPQVVRTAGRFMLSVDNRSGVDELLLLFRRGNGNKVFEIKLVKGTVDWGEALDPKPGRYTLSVVDHPDWNCEFLVNEK